MKKQESVKDYLARGGTITRVPSAASKTTETAIYVAKSGHSAIMTYESADLYYGETKANHKPPAKQTKKPNIDFSALPEELKQSLLEQYGEQEN
jgi:hypothetical protein